MLFRKTYWLSFFCCASACCLLSSAAWSQVSGPSEQLAKQVAPGNVLLDTSRVYVYVDKSGFGHEHAVAGLLRSGRIQLGAEQRAGSLVFEMASFVADPDYARKFIGLEGTSDPGTQAKVTANMLSPDVLDVARYPTAEFQIASVRATGQKSQRGMSVYEFAGEFTLHGAKRPLRFRAEVQPLEHQVRVIGGFKIRQSDYGMIPFSKAFGAVGVADELRIYGDLYVANQDMASTDVQH
jgi:YceI-like domain